MACKGSSEKEKNTLVCPGVAFTFSPPPMGDKPCYK